MIRVLIESDGTVEHGTIFPLNLNCRQRIAVDFECAIDKSECTEAMSRGSLSQIATRWTGSVQVLCSNGFEAAARCRDLSRNPFRLFLVALITADAVTWGRVGDDLIQGWDTLSYTALLANLAPVEKSAYSYGA